MLRKLLWSSVVMLVLVSLVLVGCGTGAQPSPTPTPAPTPGSTPTPSPTTTPAPKPAPKELVIAPGPADRGDYAMGVALQAMWTKYIPDLKVILVGQPTTAAISPTMAQGGAQLGLLASIPTYWAFRGMTKDYEKAGPNPKLRLMLMHNPLPFDFIVRGDSGVRSVDDLRGKRVMTNLMAEEVTPTITRAILKAYGLDPTKDVVPITVEAAGDRETMLYANKIDAYITTVRGAKLQEIEATVKGYAISLDSAAINRAAATDLAGMGVVPTIVPKGQPGARDNDVMAVGVPGLLLANADLSDDMVYQLTKILVEHHAEKDWTDKNRDMQMWSKPAQFVLEDMPIPYHAGSIKYFKEIGAWTAKAESNNQKLLANMPKAK